MLVGPGKMCRGQCILATAATEACRFTSPKTQNPKKQDTPSFAVSGRRLMAWGLAS